MNDFLDTGFDIEFMFHGSTETCTVTKLNGQQFTVRCYSLMREKNEFSQESFGIIDYAIRRFIIPVSDCSNKIQIDDELSYNNETYVVRQPVDGSVDGAYIVEAENAKMKRPGRSGVMR